MMMTMKSSKKGKKADPKKPGITPHMATLHQRLYHALNLAFRYSDDKQKEWHTNDVEIQRLVLRSVTAFLDGISPETLQIPLVKDSVPDVIRAIGSILQSQNEALLAIASEAAVKIINILPSPMLQPHIHYLIYPLSSLLSSHQYQVAVTSATSLNLIISNVSVKKDREVWEILVKTDTVSQVISNLRNFSEKVKPMEYYLAMTSILGSIMLLWPSSRYPVWSDAKLMEVMEHFCSKPLNNVKAALLHMYSALALCGNGAKMLLESSEVLRKIVECMGELQPHSVRTLAFRLVRRLMADKEGCAKMLSVSCEPIVMYIISALGYSSEHEGKVPDSEMSLMLEAFRLAMITRWQGKHHYYLWKLRIDSVLVDILIYNSGNSHLNQSTVSVEELIAMTREWLNADYCLGLRPYVWELIGWLSAQCKEDFHPENELNVNVLITATCLSFVDSIGRKRLIRQGDRAYTLRSISAAKATLMMVYSPSIYISSQTRLVLFEMLRLDGEEYLKHLIQSLKFVYFGDISRMPDEFQMLLNLIGLTCYAGLPQFYRQVVSWGGLKAVLAFIRWWLDNDVHVEKLSFASPLQNASKEKYCCRIDTKDWEGKEVNLLLAMWILAEVINYHKSHGLEVDIFSGQTVYGKEQFFKDIHNICISTSSYGLRSYCSYLLSFLGFYGFPSKLGERMASALGEEDSCDMCFVLRNGQYVNVHRVVLLVRCPSLLPPKDPYEKENAADSDGSSVRQGTHNCQRTKKEVILSAQVDEQALSKLLDYIYSGYLQAEGGVIRKLKVLAKRCNVKPLLQPLSNGRPIWAASVPIFDLSHALGLAGHEFSDIILEAKSLEDIRWTLCSYCSISMPHIHAHRVILCSSCEYLRALFQSGMQESQSKSLTVPVGWTALHKLVSWMYSNITPEPVSGCLWDNMNIERKIAELHPYIELCWLAEFWLLGNFQEECLRVITSYLDSPELSIKVIKIATDFSQWPLVHVAAKRIAPAYHSLRRSGALDCLDEGLVEIIRVASVRLAQGV